MNLRVGVTGVVDLPSDAARYARYNQDLLTKRPQVTHVQLAAVIIRQKLRVDRPTRTRFRAVMIIG
jgi:hypothetical protein